jgi:hypothetical protein
VTLRVAIALGAVLALSNVPAAQGRGRAVGQGRVAAGSPTLSGTQTSTTSLVLQPSPAFPQYGTRLDDATILDAGVGIASVGRTYWRGSNANQIAMM